MEQDIYIQHVLTTAREVISKYQTDSIIFFFVVTSRNDDNLSFNKQEFKLFTADNNYENWFVTISGQDYHVGNYPDFFEKTRDNIVVNKEAHFTYCRYLK